MLENCFPTQRPFQRLTRSRGLRNLTKLNPDDSLPRSLRITEPEHIVNGEGFLYRLETRPGIEIPSAADIVGSGYHLLFVSFQAVKLSSNPCTKNLSDDTFKATW